MTFLFLFQKKSINNEVENEIIDLIEKIDYNNTEMEIQEYILNLKLKLSIKHEHLKLNYFIYQYFHKQL